MTALSTNLQRHNKGSEGISSHPVADATHIFKGSLLQADATGYAEPAVRTAAAQILGIAIEEADNSSGANAAINVRVVERGLFRFAKHGTITQANIGESLYVYDDNTLCLVADADAENFVGTLQAIDGSYVWVNLLALQNR